MIEIEPFAAGIFLETMRTAGLDPALYAVLFHVKDNKLSFCFTDDTFYAKKFQGLLINDQTEEMNVVVEAGFNKGQRGIIIKEKQ